MSIRIKLILPVLIIGIVGCEPKSDHIIPVDFAEYEKEFVPGEKGLTQKDVGEIFARISNEIDKNTIGKELPLIMVEDMNGHEVNLRHLINGLTLMCLSGAHCGWGMDALSNGVPAALNKAKNEEMDIEAICLFIKEDAEIENLEVFNSKLNELKIIYPNLYIISSKEAKGLNAIANPTIMLVDNDKVVVDIYMEDATPEALYEYLRLKTTGNRAS